MRRHGSVVSVGARMRRAPPRQRLTVMPSILRCGHVRTRLKVHTALLPTNEAYLLVRPDRCIAATQPRHSAIDGATMVRSRRVSPSMPVTARATTRSASTPSRTPALPRADGGIVWRRHRRSSPRLVHGAACFEHWRSGGQGVENSGPSFSSQRASHGVGPSPRRRWPR